MTIPHENVEDYEMDRVLNCPEARLIAEKVVGNTLTLKVKEGGGPKSTVTGKCIAAEPHRLDQKWKCFSPSQELTFKLTLQLDTGKVKDFFIGSQQLL